MLIGNYSVLNKSPGRFLGGSGVAHASGVGTSQMTLRSNFGNTGSMRCAHYPEGTSALKLLGYPQGGGQFLAWMMPYTQGDITSRNEADLSIGVTGSGTSGLPGTGEASFTITTNDPEGQLISSGTGTATFAITPNIPLLTASLNATASTSFTISTNTPTLGAEANLTGSGSMNIYGAMVPYAIGQMIGTTEEAGLTNAGIANSVWSKVIEAGFTADQILRIVAAHAAGSATGLEGANPQFTGLDGVTLRIDGAYSAGTRTIDYLDGE